jgi:hypothetical protein
MQVSLGGSYISAVSLLDGHENESLGPTFVVAACPAVALTYLRPMSFHHSFRRSLKATRAPSLTCD